MCEVPVGRNTCSSEDSGHHKTGILFYCSVLHLLQLKMEVKTRISFGLVLQKVQLYKAFRFSH